MQNFFYNPNLELLLHPYLVLPNTTSSNLHNFFSFSLSLPLPPPLNPTQIHIDKYLKTKVVKKKAMNVYKNNSDRLM